MRQLVVIAASLVLSVFALMAADDEGLEPIFNGKDLTGWKVPNPNPLWSVKDGVLVGNQEDAKGKGNVLETEKSYGDVIVETECRWSEGADSGIFLRAGQRWQCQIGVSRSLRVDMTCSLYLPKVAYKAATAKNVDKFLKVNDWNKIKIEARGPKFKVWLNGELVLEYESADFNDPGPIGLQIHPGVVMKVEFRNLKAKELKPEPKPDAKQSDKPADAKSPVK
jgi:hypothetical protein